MAAHPDDEEGGQATGIRALVERNRERVTAGQERANRLLERHRDRPLVDAAVLVVERDREAAGAVLGSAVAFRLFLFFVPLLLFVVGLAGFMAQIIDEGDLTDAGITVSLAGQIDEALNQHNSTRWVAVIFGLFGMAWTGRTLSKVMVQASCLAWRMPMRRKASARLIGGVVGLTFGIGLVATLVNKVRQELGIGVTSLSFIAAFGVYAVAWVLLSMALPRASSDPGTLLPGAVLVAGTLAGLQAVSQVYLPARFDRASELYGALGATIVVLGWFFILGRAIVLSMAIDAVVHERFGSISRVVFALPVLRLLPRRSARLRQFFQLD